MSDAQWPQPTFAAVVIQIRMDGILKGCIKRKVMEEIDSLESSI